MRWYFSFVLCICVLVHWACGPSDSTGQSEVDAGLSKKNTTHASLETAAPGDSFNTLKNGSQIDEFKGEFYFLEVGSPMFDSLDITQQQALYAQFRAHYTNRECIGDEPLFCRVRHILEQVMLHSSGISVDIRNRIKSYLTRLWLFEGNTDPATGERVNATFIPGELAAATQIALRNGADIDLSSVANAPLDANNIEQLEALLAEIRPYIFGGDDTDTDSQNAEKQRNGASSSDSSAAVAASGADAEKKIHLIYFEDPHFLALLAALDTMADYCDRKVREVGGTKSTAPRRPGAHFVAGHVVSLPSAQTPLVPLSGDISALGLSSVVTDDAGNPVHVLWLNVNDAYESTVGARLAGTFSPSRAVYKNRAQHRQLVSVAYHALRDLVGFGADGTENKPADWLRKRLGENDEVFAQLRADLAALYMAFDPEVQRTGLVPDLATRDAFIEEYLLSVVEQLAVGAKPDKNLPLKVRLIVLNYLLQSGTVTASASAPGEYIVRIPDPEAIRVPLIQLLGRVRNIRFFGDGPKAAALVASLGFVPAGWIRGMERRFADLNISPQLLLMMPVMERRSSTAARGAPAYLLNTSMGFYERNIYLASFADQ